MDKLDQAYLTDLVRRSSQGGSNAFAELFTATQARVCRYLGSLPLTGDLPGALRAVMGRALQSLSSLTDADLFLPWVCRIAFRLFGPSRSETVETPAGTTTIERLLHLPLAESQVLLMRFAQGFSQSETGDILNLSPGLVRRCERMGKKHLLRDTADEVPPGGAASAGQTRRRAEAQLPDALTAAMVLEQVLEDCGREQNTVPTEALASYTLYRKERFSLQRGVLAAALAMFFLLPLLFVLPKYDISAEPLGARGLPVYTIRVRPSLPIGSVTAEIRGRALPVYEASARVFSVEPTRNGPLTVTVQLINRQSVIRSVTVSDVDSEGPVLEGSLVESGTVLLYVSDAGIGVDYADVYAVNASGERILPISTDADAGTILFDYPKENWDVYIPDYIGNLLHLSITLT
ncbi:MAG: hypothetical protein IJP64_02335 [Oscillospiraceae bacterium]|nr:hypothetical protein [Oscillospiraceae bacterium]